MDLTGLIESIQSSALGEWIRTSLLAMPVIEAIHVMAGAVVFGTILIVDLRLIGFPSTHRSFLRVSDELLHFTWAAFVVAVITGVMMFTSDAITYYANTPFRLKMLALLAAGVNMAVFQFRTVRSVASWDKDAAPPFAARAAGVLSITIWIGVIFLGRWIGFAQDYDFQIPENMDFDFDSLLEESLPESNE